MKTKFRVDAVSTNLNSIKLVPVDSQPNRVFNWTPSGHIEITEGAKSNLKVGQHVLLDITAADPKPEPKTDEEKPVK